MSAFNTLRRANKGDECLNDHGIERDKRNLPVNKSGALPAIDLAGVHLTLASEAGRVNILHDIHLHIAAGGPSGSGKTSLLLLIAGLEQASAGRIAVAGQDLTDMSEDALALLRRDRIGIVFQNFHLIPTMNAAENVAVPLELAGVADAFGRAEAALASVGLSHRLTHYPAQLSGGEQQRVALARALAPRPALLLADEPTGNLDLETGAKIIDLLFAQAQAIDATLLLITHDPALAARCGRQLHMADGQIVSDSANGGV
jgi:putative ABC transport system ATP-binding protein